MTLQEFKTEYASNVRNWTVDNLKSDRAFMKLCREDESFRDWVLSQRGDMANENRPRIKFRRYEGIPGALPEKAAHVDPVEPEEVSKVVEFYRDVVEYAKKKGMLIL